MITPIQIKWSVDDSETNFRLDLDTGYTPDFAVVHYLQQGQPCEPEVCWVMKRTLKAGSIAVDAGAGVGFFTVLMSKMVGPTGRVYAFEPGENNLRRLRRNLDLNDCNNVVVSSKPLSDRRKHVNFYVYQDGGDNSLYPLKDGDCASVTETTLLDRDVPAADLIKLDIEGGEIDALRGGHMLLRKSDPIIISEVNEITLGRAGLSVQKLRDILAPRHCFNLSMTGHFPTYIPDDLPIRLYRQNTNMLFAGFDQVKKLWPEADI